MLTTGSVATTDGLSLAVHRAGDPTAPTLVAVHGYPDDHTVWDGVVARLADRFHVVTYDVRGCGGSEAPTSRQGYRIAQLNRDLGAVLDATAPGERVHLLAHDWGSIQSWSALTDPQLAPRLLSYTSISGPSLDMAARWLRDPRHLRATLAQLADSCYVFGFQVPRLPEALIRRGVLDRVIRHSQRAGAHAAPRGRRVVERDAVNGLELYRANFVDRMIRPRTAPITAPVQVLAPEDDAHVTVALQTEAPAAYVRDLTTHRIPGNHWVVEQDPDLVVRHVVGFIDQL